MICEVYSPSSFPSDSCSLYILTVLYFYRGQFTDGSLALFDVAGIKASIVQGDAGCRLYGCYESLQAGFTTRALQDLTGGIVQSFGLSNQDRYLTFQVLNSAVPRSSLLIASINLVSSEFRSPKSNCPPVLPLVRGASQK